MCVRHYDERLHTTFVSIIIGVIYETIQEVLHISFSLVTICS